MDKEKFQEDLKASLPLISQEPSFDAKTDKYHNILDSIMDKLAPLKKKKIKKDMKQPWNDEQLSNEIQLRHLKERKWKHSGNEHDYCFTISEETCHKGHSCQTKTALQ